MGTLKKEKDFPFQLNGMAACVSASRDLSAAIWTVYYKQFNEQI